jgi:hypothetical protein
VKPGPKPPKIAGHPFYELRGQLPVTREQVEFCRRRVGGLLNYGDLSSVMLIDLLGNAYALGLADATEYLRDRKQ